MAAILIVDSARSAHVESPPSYADRRPQHDEKQNRAVWVHSAALLEGVRKVYGAETLADALQGRNDASK